ncbi:hypothetical protein HWV62_33299 [Athelia sp. TMB]|nr:hypothetical protein HWV62_33299 [Athelia sp. TMB]
MFACILFAPAYDHIPRRIFELLDVCDILNVSSTAAVAWIAWKRYCAGVFGFDRLTSKFFESHLLFKDLFRDTYSVLLATSVIFMLRRGPPGDRPLDVLIEARHLEAFDSYLVHQEGYEPWIENSYKVQEYINTFGQDRSTARRHDGMLPEQDLRSRERSVAAVFTFYKVLPGGGQKHVRIAVATTSIMKSVLTASTCRRSLRHVIGCLLTGFPAEGMALMTDALIVVMYPYATFVRKESLGFKQEKHKSPKALRRHLHFLREPYEIVDRTDFWYEELADVFDDVGPIGQSGRAVGDSSCWTILLNSSNDSTEALLAPEPVLLRSQLKLNRWSLILEDDLVRVQPESVQYDAIRAVRGTLL